MRRNTVQTQTLYVNVGAAIRLARMADGVGQGELARKIGMKQAHLKKIEDAESACPLHVLVAIADVLDRSLDELVPVTTEERESA